MALTLTSSISSTLEPFRKNRWIIQFSSIPSYTGTDYPEKLAFAAHTASRPTLVFGVTEYQRLNEKFFIAGKPAWSELSMAFFDYMGTNSASNILYKWSTSIYNPITGGMGFKVDYAAPTATLAMLDPAGGVQQVWNLFYIWPYSLTYGDLSADEDGISEVTAIFRYDYAVKAEETSTGSNGSF